jgi:hypothetical protein
MSMPADLAVIFLQIICSTSDPKLSISTLSFQLKL